MKGKKDAGQQDFFICELRSLGGFGCAWHPEMALQLEAAQELALVEAAEELTLVIAELL